MGTINLQGGIKINEVFFMSDVRVRFAPSPTGYLHIGGARTALFNWLYAKKMKGCFILRIEDTDVERSTEESTDQIIESMKWLGFSCDEGPYFQSQRLELYREKAKILLENKSAYKCFCSKERLDEMREKARKEKLDFKYDGKCRNLSPEEIVKKEAAGEPFVIRFHVAEEGDTFWQDGVSGEIRFENARIGDFIIMRPGGHPTYNFCVVVDDSDMRITDVIRGTGHISNTPKQILIYKALGVPIPGFAHVPLILGSDKSKLSKRHGAASVMEYAKQGFLPEAVFNFLSLLGWSPGNDEEIMSLDRLVEMFDLSGIGKANAVFDQEKLKWMNGMYIRNMPKDEIAERVIKFMPTMEVDPSSFDETWLKGVIGLFIERARTLVELVDQMHYFLKDDFEYDEKAIKKVTKKGNPVEYLEIARDALVPVEDFTVKSMEDAMRIVIEEKKVGFGKIAQPMRMALTGGLASPGIFDVLFYLGKEKSLKRFDRAISFFSEEKN
jgi:glutamyl-tRNA synthetase